MAAAQHLERSPAVFTARHEPQTAASRQGTDGGHCPEAIVPEYFDRYWDHVFGYPPGAGQRGPRRGGRRAHEQPGRALLLPRQARAAAPAVPCALGARQAGPAGAGRPDLKPARSGLRQDRVRHSGRTAPRVCRAGAIRTGHGPSRSQPLRPELRREPPPRPVVKGVRQTPSQPTSRALL